MKKALNVWSGAGGDLAPEPVKFEACPSYLVRRRYCAQLDRLKGEKSPDH